MAVFGPELLERLGGEWRGAADEETHAVSYRGSRFGIPVVHADVHGGDAEEECCLELQKLGSGVSMVEAFEQAHPASGQQPGVQPVAEAVDVE